ncbi:MAG: aspartate kinase [Proteobacteria bacterium]|nr:aspartate kinase [Pseudomonadota bacterium]
MALIVQKYGGTSVGSLALIHNVAAQVARVHARGDGIVVVASAMGDETDRLLDLARALIPHPEPRELDALLATGEQVSVALLAMVLCSMDIPARSYTGAQVRVRTSAVHGKARIEGIDTERLRADLQAGRVPVVAGFQGVSEHGDITTIGRGGSDTTAVALAVALKADECQILTDVDGVFTTDPRMVPQARCLARVSFEEMLELAGQGSKVLHLRAVEFARKYNMPLRVASAFRRGAGTLICEEESTVEAPVVSGIAFNRDEAEFSIFGLPDEPGTAYRLLKPVSDANIEVDMIVISASPQGRSDLSFTVHRDDYVQTKRIIEAILKGFPESTLEATDRVAKLSVVGVGMRSHAGVAARLFETMAREAINVRLVSTSEIKISLLVEEEKLERAVRALHTTYALSVQD